MTAKSVLMRPQDLRPRARAPLATLLAYLEGTLRPGAKNIFAPVRRAEGGSSSRRNERFNDFYSFFFQKMRIVRHIFVYISA